MATLTVGGGTLPPGGEVELYPLDGDPAEGPPEKWGRRLAKSHVGVDGGVVISGLEAGAVWVKAGHHIHLAVAVEDADELSGDDLDARAVELDIEGRSKMSADEKRQAIAERERA